MKSSPEPESQVRSHVTRIPEILRLAVPSLGVLLAQPAYVLLDTAIIGRLGVTQLAALAVAGTILTVVSSQLTFLSYGTTARSARSFGAGHYREALNEGVQASWLAVVIGVAIALIVEVFCEPLTTAFVGNGSSSIATDAQSWLTVAAWGVPFILLGMAGNGWLRGIQDVTSPLAYVVSGVVISAVLCPVLVFGLLGCPRLGLVGSAWANVAGQSVTALLFLFRLTRESRLLALSAKPDPRVIRQNLRLGKDLMVRSLSFQICFVFAGAVLARKSSVQLASHQIAWELWSFVVLILDSLAIAAQTLIGASLGGAHLVRARALSWRVMRESLLLSIIISVIFASAFPFIAKLFTDDSTVLSQLSVLRWFLVSLIPVGGIVFALDGVLLGAGDTRFLSRVTIIFALTIFLPAILLSDFYGWGFLGVWFGFSAFMVGRTVAGVVRVRGNSWMVTDPTTL